jgi:hypothetical protein
MVLDWKKVAVFAVLVAVVTALALTKVLSAEVTAVTVSTIVGWVGGLFTPLKEEKKLPAADNAAQP